MPAPDLTVKTYDPKMVVITFGVIPISGYAEGTFVSVNRSGDAFVKSKGAGGDVERINKNQGDFEVTVTLQQTATVNAELSAALAADQVTNAGVFPLTIKDLLGKTLFSPRKHGFGSRMGRRRRFVPAHGCLPDGAS